MRRGSNESMAGARTTRGSCQEIDWRRWKVSETIDQKEACSATCSDRGRAG